MVSALFLSLSLLLPPLPALAAEAARGTVEDRRQELLPNAEEFERQKKNMIALGDQGKRQVGVFACEDMWQDGLRFEREGEVLKKSAAAPSLVSSGTDAIGAYDQTVDACGAAFDAQIRVLANGYRSAAERQVAFEREYGGPEAFYRDWTLHLDKQAKIVCIGLIKDLNRQVKLFLAAYNRVHDKLQGDATALFKAVSDTGDARDNHCGSSYGSNPVRVMTMPPTSTVSAPTPRPAAGSPTDMDGTMRSFEGDLFTSRRNTQTAAPLSPEDQRLGEGLSK